jgi:hypothetical protein
MVVKDFIMIHQKAKGKHLENPKVKEAEDIKAAMDGEQKVKEARAKAKMGSKAIASGVESLATAREIAPTRTRS